MELSPEIQAALGLCTSIPNEQFTKLAENAVSAAVDSSTDELVLAEVDPAVVKQLHAALVIVALEAAKHGLDDGVSDVFVDHGVDKGRSTVFGKIYVARAGELRDKLRSTGFGPPRVIGVDWRLGLGVRSSELEHISAANYVVTFKLEGGKSVEFTCTADELMDMSSKFADASKQIERLSQQ